MNIFQKAILFLTDPAEYYAEKTREEFRKLYEEGRIDWMPEKITACIDEDGDVTIYIQPLPPVIHATPNFTYDTKNPAIDSPLDKP